MNPPHSPAPDTRAQLRRRWLDRAAAAFDRLFAPDQQDDLVTFTQREDRACDLGKDLAAWLLQQHAAADPRSALRRNNRRSVPSAPGRGGASRRPTHPCPSDR